MASPEPQHSPEELADMFDVEREDIYMAMGNGEIAYRELGEGNYYLPLNRFVSLVLPNIARETAQPKTSPPVTVENHPSRTQRAIYKEAEPSKDTTADDEQKNPRDWLERILFVRPALKKAIARRVERAEKAERERRMAARRDHDEWEERLRRQMREPDNDDKHWYRR